MQNRGSATDALPVSELSAQAETKPVLTLIEALNYRCLRYVHQPLGPFHVLVGPNASGKTTFLDVVSFLGKLVADGLEASVTERTQNFQDLVFQKSQNGFELAVEARIPESQRRLVSKPEFDTVRYEVRLEVTSFGEVMIAAEKGLLKVSDFNHPPLQRTLFPAPPAPPQTILSSKMSQDCRTVFNKVAGGNDNFYSEVYGAKGKGWAPAFKLGTRKSTLGNLPEDESKFPVTTWLKRILIEGVQQFVLNSLLIRRASPPGQVRTFKPDGSNLPWVVDHLQKNDPARFADWVAHLRTALPDIETIRTVEREDDRHRYLVVRYQGGWELPSWVVSDGTLRLFALTLPAYLPHFQGIYLIEEPENGIHPSAVETIFQSLSSVYDAQILLATHSPVILSLAKTSDILCFAKNSEGATDIIAGNEHPALREWSGEANLGVLFASGVLG